jgi:hypothetical protein
VVIIVVVRSRRIQQPEAHAVAESVDVPARGQDPQAASLDRLRLAEIENRLTSIESSSVPKRSAGPAPLPAHLPNQEERARQISQDFDDHQQRLNQSATEPRNDHWATPMEQRINSAFQKMPDGVKARYSGVDCRSTTCSVGFVWPSREAAEGELRMVVGSLATTGCMREIALAPPDGRNSETQGQLLLICRGTEEATPVPVAKN